MTASARLQLPPSPSRLRGAFSPSSQISLKASVIGRKRSAIAFAYVCAATYAGLFGKQTAGTMTFRLMSPHPPYVLEPTLAMVAMTVLRLPLRTPCSWKA